MTSILGKPPVHTSTTPFSDYVAEAAEWAKANEDDRIKFFLYHHAPSFLKSKTEDYFVEDLTQFKRIQAIWSHQSDDFPVSNRPVNYDRLRKHQRRNRHQDNDHYGYSNQNQNYGNYGQNFNNRNQNHGYNFNDRDQNYINSSGNNENNYDNRGQNSNNGYNNCHNVPHAGEAPSRQANNANNISRQKNFLTVTTDKEGGINNSLVRLVKHGPKTCKIGYRRSNLPQIVHISQNRKLYYNRTNLNKRKNLKFCKFSQAKRQPRICRYYKLGICNGGESGTDNDFICKFAHPKVCKNFCEYSHDFKLGCSKSRKCKFYHPKIYQKVWHFGECFNTKCSFRHLKTTN